MFIVCLFFSKKIHNQSKIKNYYFISKTFIFVFYILYFSTDSLPRTFLVYSICFFFFLTQCIQYACELILLIFSFFLRRIGKVKQMLLFLTVLLIFQLINKTFTLPTKQDLLFHSFLCLKVEIHYLLRFLQSMLFSTNSQSRFYVLTKKC